MPGFVQHPIQALDQASAGLKQWFVGVGEWWNQKWAGFKENWDKAWNGLVDTIKNLPAKFLDYGKNIVQGLINGINNGIENAKKTVGGLAKAIIDKFRPILKFTLPPLCLNALVNLSIKALQTVSVQLSPTSPLLCRVL